MKCKNNQYVIKVLKKQDNQTNSFGEMPRHFTTGDFNHGKSENLDIVFQHVKQLYSASTFYENMLCTWL